MATKTVKQELLNDDIKEFGEDAATAINELLGIYGYDDDNKRNELSVKYHQNSCKKIASISQKLLEAKRLARSSESESLRSKMNDYSSVSSDKDSSSRENSKSPMAMKLTDENNCSWCHQDINSQATEIIGSAGTVFCSENCFLFWRRASFKRAKTCDFCKNVRNAVSYVDFNDGMTQLQFCSDKCLNQYKMQIFCRETQAQLELNPHLKEKKTLGEDTLITPDLWLKNCRTRSPSPETSRTPTPTTNTASEKSSMPKMSITQSQPSASSSTVTSSSVNLSCDNAKKPMINVLPSSKLLSRNMLHQKNLRKRRISARLALNNKTNQVPNNNGASSSNERIMNSNFPSDLRAKIHSQMNNSPKQLPQTNFNRPPLQFLPRPPINLFKFRPPFHNFPAQRMPPPPPPDDPNQQCHQMGLSSLVPPPIVLVPHPVIVPIIIPIPLPLSAFWNAYQVGKNPPTTPSSTTENDNESHHEDAPPQPPQPTPSSSQPEAEDESIEVAADVKAEDNEQPLDYTTSKSPETNDNNLPLHDNNENENGIDSISSDRIENSSNGNNAEKIPKFKITRLNIKRSLQRDADDFANESSRPLRKRRIIAEVDNLSESP